MMLSVLSGVCGCDWVNGAVHGAVNDAESAESEAALPAGSSCLDTKHCPREQVCVGQVCRYLATSVTGEYLAVVAKSLSEAGDHQEAARTYEAAVAAFHRASAPTPPPIQCQAAAALLAAASTPEARESAAREADRCFRSSLPAAPERRHVMQLVAKLRFDGLDAAKFDSPQPAPRFFTAAPSRPSVDAVEVAVDMPVQDAPAHAETRMALRGPAATRGVAECFVTEWQQSHQKRLDATLRIKYTSRMRDMGDYDVYVPTIEVTGTAAEETSFDTCVREAITQGLNPPHKVRRSASWESQVKLAARMP